MEIVRNPHRGRGLESAALADAPLPSAALDRAADLLKRCPRAAATPLVDAAALAQTLGVAEARLKDERDRLGLGSFKGLGAAYAIALDAERGAARGASYAAASAGNHGLSVAAGAQAFDAEATIFLSDQVPEGFAERLRALGADVVRAGSTYEASMAAAADWAEDNGATLLSDSSWPGYFDAPYAVMEGYLALMREVFDQMSVAPTHVFLQAGVGGLAGSAAAAVRAHWGDGPIIVVVEPDRAPALAASIKAGAPVATDGAASAMARLDCKEPSLIALKGLARDADFFATITEAEGAAGAALAADAGYPSTPSGAAGLAGLVAAAAGRRDEMGVGPASRILAILSEGPER